MAHRFGSASNFKTFFFLNKQTFPADRLLFLDRFPLVSNGMATDATSGAKCLMDGRYFSEQRALAFHFTFIRFATKFTF